VEALLLMVFAELHQSGRITQMILHRHNSVTALKTSIIYNKLSLDGDKAELMPAALKNIHKHT